jgi:hypothetical protein
MNSSDGDQRRHRRNPLTARSLDPLPGGMTLQKGPKPGGMTLQKLGQPLVLVAASVCKCGGGMTLQKSAFRWRHEAANWHTSSPHLLLLLLRVGFGQRTDPDRPCLTHDPAAMAEWVKVKDLSPGRRF